MASPLIVVGVPVWRGSKFVAETLESVIRQRDIRLRVFISIDGADGSSEQVCRPFTADARVQLFVQPERLGWVRNSAAVLAAATDMGADYACIQPHDDILDENYFAALLDVAEKSTEAAVVFSDMEAFGTESGIVHQSSVIGSALGRQVSLLLDHYNGIAFRGLTRVSALVRVPPISGNLHDDFAADTVWMSRLALAGELIRVPRVLYRKRYHPDDTHSKWREWPIERKMAAWTQHCLDMLAEALKAGNDPISRRLLMEAARARLLLLGAPLGPYQAELGAMGPDQRLQMLSAFDAAVAADHEIVPNKFSSRVWWKFRRRKLRWISSRNA